MTKAGPFSLRKPTFLLETGRSTGIVLRQSGSTCARSSPHRMPPLRFLAPPSSARSTRRVLMPFWARRMAAAQPANPAPTTMHWNWLFVPGRDWGLTDRLQGAATGERFMSLIQRRRRRAAGSGVPFGAVRVALVARHEAGLVHHGEDLDELDGLLLARHGAQVGHD